MQLYLAAQAEEMPRLDARLRAVCVDYHFSRPLPAGLPARRDGVMLVGGDLSAARAGELAEECRRRELTAVLAGFGQSPALETARFCDALLRRGLQPILTESAWRGGCGAEMLISTALTAGDLSGRLKAALERCPQLCLDLERLCRSVPAARPGDEGAALSRQALAGLLRQGGKVSLSPELMCKSLRTEIKGEGRLILFDDRETLEKKLRLAASLGIRRGFLLYPEWSAEDARAAAEAVSQQGKSPTI